MGVPLRTERIWTLEELRALPEGNGPTDLPRRYDRVRHPVGLLVAFYHATGGPGWSRNDDWLSDSPLSGWYGISVNGAGQVLALTLGTTTS